MKRFVPISEKAFQRTVVEYARLMGWRIHHTRPALAQSGRWHTPLQGDKGLPDLILCRPPRLLFVELKASRLRKPTPDQQAWLDALRACGVEVYLWTPEDWTTIEATLAPPASPPSLSQQSPIRFVLLTSELAPEKRLACPPQPVGIGRECPDCAHDAETPKGLCAECAGTGRQDDETCYDCGGSGLCPTCNGTGEGENLAP